jgi:hypothetical protein
MNVEHTELKREGRAQSATATWYAAGPEPTGDAFGNSVSALLAVPRPTLRKPSVPSGRLGRARRLLPQAGSGCSGT